MPTSGSAGPFIAFEHIGMDTNLGGQMADDCRREIGLVVGKTPVLPPVGELCRKPEPAAGRQRRQQRQVVSSERPVFAEFLSRPQPLHLPPPFPWGAENYTPDSGWVTPTWPKRTASRLLGQVGLVTLEARAGRSR